MNVRQLREQRGLSQQELAAMTGIPKDRIAKWEQGKGAPKAEDSKILDKYFKEQVPATAPQTPQNGHGDNPKQTLTRIGDLIKRIQYSTNPTLSIEQIAERIDYGRTQLTKLANKGDSKKAYNLLKKEFAKELESTDKLTTVTKKPDYGVKPTNGHQSDKDLVITEQAQTNNKLADSIKNNSETIKKLVDLLADKGVH